MSEILDIAAALSRLLKAENVLLICHKNPDGDTIGSAAALYWAWAKQWPCCARTPSRPGMIIWTSACTQASSRPATR